MQARPRGDGRQARPLFCDHRPYIGGVRVDGQVWFAHLLVLVAVVAAQVVFIGVTLMNIVRKSGR